MSEGSSVRSLPGELIVSIDAYRQADYTIRIDGAGGLTMSVESLYQNQIRGLSIIERLRLAKLIMDDLSDSAADWVVDNSDAWSQQDLYDMSRASARYAGRVIADREDDAQIG
jgi:hypothetical protein